MSLRSSFVVLTIIAVGVSGRTSTATQPTLKPLLAIPGRVVIDEDFSKPNEHLDKSIYLKRQGTRWTIEDGVLRGQQSSPEFQASKKDHFGYEPRLSIPATPAEFVASFSFRFIDGEETNIVPFVEFGHHVCRVRFSSEGTSLLVEKESLKVDEASDFVWQSGQWYHVLAEMKDGEFVMQIAGGPTLHAAHPTFRKAPTSGGNGIGFAGPRAGWVEIDNLRVHEAGDIQPNWQATRASLGKIKASVLRSRE